MVMRRKNAGPRGFTLIELLVVIAIMGILMGSSVIAFQNMSKGSAMRSAVMQVRTGLSLARQWAITHREITYVVFPDATVIPPTSYERFNELGKAYRSFNLYTDSDKYLREWTTLPEGVAFSKTCNIFAGNDGNAALYRKTNVDFGTNKVSAIVLGFKPDGTPLISDIYAPPVLDIVEAVLDVTTNPPAVNYILKPTPNSASLEVSAMVGLVKVTTK